MSHVGAFPARARARVLYSSLLPGIFCRCCHWSTGRSVNGLKGGGHTTQHPNWAPEVPLLTAPRPCPCSVLPSSC